MSGLRSIMYSVLRPFVFILLKSYIRCNQSFALSSGHAYVHSSLREFTVDHISLLLCWSSQQTCSPRQRMYCRCPIVQQVTSHKFPSALYMVNILQLTSRPPTGNGIPSWHEFRSLDLFCFLAKLTQLWVSWLVHACDQQFVQLCNIYIEARRQSSCLINPGLSLVSSQTVLPAHTSTS